MTVDRAERRAVTRARAQRRARRRRIAAAAALCGGAVLVVAVVLLRGGAGGSAQPHRGAPPSTRGRLRSQLPPGRPLTILWGGDVSLGSSHGDAPNGGRAALAGVAARLHKADLTAVNLEGTLSAGGASKCFGPDTPTCFAFQAPPADAAALHWAGIDIVNLANNHAWDFGAMGMGQTVRALGRAHVAFTGRPGEIRVVSLPRTKIAFVGFSAYPWTSPIRDLAFTRNLIREAGTRANIVVAFMHAGAEGHDQTHVPRRRGDRVRRGPREQPGVRPAVPAIDAGADLVLGSGRTSCAASRSTTIGSSPTRWATSPVGTPLPPAGRCR